MDISDEELYARTREGDRAAFDELYRRREPGLFRFALHMSGTRAAAEDLTHEAFVTLLRDESRFDPRWGSVEAYLYGAVRNMVRADKRRAMGALTMEPPVKSDILGNMIADENVRILRAALNRLPEGYREVVVLCDLEQRSYEDVAGIVGCPVGTVRSRLHRARALLAAALRPVARRAAP
jgi:RNA polymerase sigma-70 factor (ECF subfamily)